MIKNDVVASSILFESLPQDHLDDLAAIAQEKAYKKGETIFFEGEPGRGFFVVTEGKVKIFKVSATGKEQILHIFGKGEVFAEVPVFHGKPFPASAEALVATTTIFFPRDTFVGVLEKNPAIAMRMLAVLSQKLRRFTRQIEDLSLKEVPARIAGYLLYLAEEQACREKVVLDISKGQLASLLGTSPETLSRIFAKMSAEKMIEVQGRTIFLLDRERLVARQTDF